MPAKKDDIKEAVEPEKKDESEVISVKKVVYIEIDDEVTAVYDKVSAVGTKHVYIVAPQRAILFQSLVNLKILRRKAEEGSKKIYLITNDKNGIHLAQKAGISVYNQASSGKAALFSTEMNDERLRITPLKASVNSVEEEAPTRMTERKISISEILRRKRHKDVDVTRMPKPEKKTAKKARSKFVIVAPNRHALTALVAISLVILLVIVYIALPGVTIYVTPAASVLEKSVNITLADAQRHNAEMETAQGHVIASYPINTTVNRSITHFPTGKKFSDKASNASGLITIINTTNSAWPLVASTRFQNDDGIVFRIASGVTVPASTADGPGKLETFVTADQVDAYGAIVGDRGNIEAGRFFLPGLRESSRSQIYAESAAAMTGGVTDYISFITAEDIEAAKSRLRDELLKSAVEELKVAVQQKSEFIGVEGAFRVLEGEKAILTGEAKIEIESGLEGREVGEFSVFGSVEVSGVYYDDAVMLEILRNELLLKKSPQKELVRINEDSTSYRIFEWDTAGGKIKLTANIKGIEQFEIDPEKENGARLLKKIKDHIVGKDIEAAQTYIQNLPEINKVSIDSWPAWSPTIPNIPDNIDFEVRDAVAAE